MRFGPLVLVLGVIASLAPTASHAASCAPAAAAGGDWPLYGHDLRNSRHQEAETAIDPGSARTLAPAWTFSSRAAGGAGDFTGTPVVADGCVFVGSNLGWVYAVNADTGELVWAMELPNGGTINNSLAVDGGRVFAFVSRVSSPYVAAFDASTGAILWERTVDGQEGADAFASPVVFDGIVIVGVSGDSAQHGDQGQLIGFRGSYVLLEASSGDVLKQTYTIPPEVTDGRYAGATVTTTAAVDADAKVAYEGTGSAFLPQFEHERANALLKIDLDKDSLAFGQILGSYKGDTFDAVVPGYSSLQCYDLPIPPPPPIIPAGRGVGACGDVDVDFAASPNLIDVAGKLLVADSQKSGAFHAVDAQTMTGLWRVAYTIAQPFGGSSAAFDGTSLYSSAAPPGDAYSLDAATGSLRWVSPIADGAHYGLPVASANGVIYTMDVLGSLDAFDAATGLPLLHRPVALGADTGADPVLSFGGVSVARNTVYAAIGFQNTGLDFLGAANGYVVAFRTA
jgi:outer membrane protein assembly factor BamB